MELFYAENVGGGICALSPEEAAHCVKVLRHRAGDEVCVIDGQGTMYRCRLLDASPKACRAEVIEAFEGWGSHAYRLNMAVCPTKNNERFEWFVEKATELGVDVISPVIGEHSERRVYKTERAGKIALSAAKQSLKAAVPEIAEPLSVKEFIRAHAESDALKLIAYCFEDEAHPRTSIRAALDSGLRGGASCRAADTNADAPCCAAGGNIDGSHAAGGREIIVLIGPEGDFSHEEAACAIASGFIPVHLGPSRLRTETAALTAVEAVYLFNLD